MAKDALSATPQKSESRIMEVYWMFSNEIGEVGTLKVDQSDGTIKFRLSAYLENVGRSEFRGTMEKGEGEVYLYTKGDCQLVFRFSKAGCEVGIPGVSADCGVGRGGVDVSGSYVQTSTARPAL
jgi:hypothetical protein